MANMQTVKLDKEIKLSDISVEVHRQDGHIKSITFRDSLGQVVQVVVQQYGSGLDVLIPAPPKMIKRWQIAGKLKGIAFCESFDSEFAADMRRRELELTTDECPITECEVPEEA